VTDHDTPTVPPPGPLPSTLPDDMAHNPTETYAIGRVLEAIEVLQAYTKGRFDGDVAAAVNKLGADERKARADFEARIDKKLDTIIANQTLLLGHFETLTARMNLLEGQHASNHHVKLSVPPSTREPEAKAE
jgi:hypothetical protein